MFASGAILLSSPQCTGQPPHSNRDTWTRMSMSRLRNSLLHVNISCKSSTSQTTSHSLSSVPRVNEHCKQEESHSDGPRCYGKAPASLTGRAVSQLALTCGAFPQVAFLLDSPIPSWTEVYGNTSLTWQLLNVY